MGKAAGYSGRAGSSAGAVRSYGFSHMPRVMPSRGGSIDLFKAWEEMRQDKGRAYEVGPGRIRPYDRAGPLEKEVLAMAAITSVDYGGNHRQLYSANVVSGAESGYGGMVKGDSYQTNVVNLAAYRAAMLDNAYRKTNGEGYQSNFEYSQAA